MQIKGEAKYVQIVGNRFVANSMCAFQLENRLPGTKSILIANNTCFECPTAFRLWDEAVRGEDIQIRNNLILSASQPDMVFADSGGSPNLQRGFGDGQSVLDHPEWQVDHNWRELTIEKNWQEQGWIPGPKDTIRDTGEVDSVYLSPNRDMRFGNLRWNDATKSWDELWGTTPYNLVEVTLRRDQTISGNGDGRLPLFFAPVIGHDTANLKVSATIAMIPAVGFRLIPGNNETLNLLPITMDEETWENLIQNHSGPDNYSYDPNTGQVLNGPDGVHEADLYPDDDNSLPAGNRGTVDFGPGNNSTADIERQILYGLNDIDLSYFPNNEIRLDVTPLDLAGDTGLSAGIKDELAAIIGETRIIPIFRTVVHPGNNAVFTIVRFVGIRIMAVDLTGAEQHVYIQPDSFVDINAVRGGDGPISVIREDTVFAKPYLYR